jgi:DNA processing protein
MEELTSLIALSRLRGITGNARRWILETHERITPLFSGKVKGLPGEVQTAIKGFTGFKGIDAELKKLKALNGEAISIRDERYPALLKEIPDPPLVLYKRGSLPFSWSSLSVVGARKATFEGMLLAERIGETLSSVGVCVVSGLARGIDAHAHKGAMRQKGRTIGVLGCGLDICYPMENKRLFDQMTSDGAIISEYGLGEPPVRHHFPERNRIIAGLSKGVLVVEASSKSGSLITARLALEYGREVMAIPGRIFDDAYKGANNLIKQGARLVEDITDILAASFPEVRFEEQKTHVDLDVDEDYIYRLIGTDRIHVDELIEKSRIATRKVMATLTGLEMKNLIQAIPGGYYVRGLASPPSCGKSRPGVTTPQRLTTLAVDSHSSAGSVKDPVA